VAPLRGARDFEFFSVPEGRWGWFYIDHQSCRLRNVVIHPDADGSGVTLSSGGSELAQYDIIGATFSLLDESGRVVRTLSSPQEWRDPSARHLR